MLDHFCLALSHLLGMHGIMPYDFMLFSQYEYLAFIILHGPCKHHHIPFFWSYFEFVSVYISWSSPFSLNLSPCWFNSFCLVPIKLISHAYAKHVHVQSF